MGNEASMEGGDGALAGELTGPEAELSRLSEEERRRLVSTMAEAQARMYSVMLQLKAEEIEGYKEAVMMERSLWWL